MSYKGNEDKKDTSGVRGSFQMGDKKIYWEGWSDPEQAEYEIKRAIRIVEERSKE